MKKAVSMLLSALLVFSLCTGAFGEEAPAIQYTPGTYTGTAVGRNGEIVVEVTVSEDRIESIDVVDEMETEGVGDIAIQTLKDEIVEYQSLGVDSVSGATLSSFAMKQAVEKAIEQAGVDGKTLRAVKVDYDRPESIEETYDVVIVGAGAAGFASGLAAAQAGASTIIIETNEIIGGNTLVSGMAWNAVDPEEDAKIEINEAQKISLQEFLDMDPESVGEFKDTLLTLQDQIREYQASGSTTLFDSIEMHMMHFYVACVRTGLDGTQIVPNVDLVRKFAENSLDAIDWLKDFGVQFNTGLSTVTGSLWPRGHSFVSKTAAFDVMRTRFEEMGGVVMVNTHADSLIYEDGTVKGVLATYEKSVPVTLHANKSVILACGGFGGNRKMADEYNNYWPQGLLNARSDQIASTQGDGIAMAVAIGADTEGMGFTQLFPAVNIVTGDNGPTGGNSAEFNCYINKNGERFVNEFAERDVMSKAALAQPDGVFWHIIDQQMMDKRHASGKGPNEKQLAVYVERKALYVCNSVAEMAEVIGCDPDTLQATMDAYNKAVADGYDPLTGRRNFGATIDVPPYYIMPVSPAIHNTMGGLKINTDNAVLDTEGNPISGLFAAGEVTGGIHAGNRMGGNAIGDAFTMGRNAGINAAK